MEWRMTRILAGRIDSRFIRRKTNAKQISVIHKRDKTQLSELSATREMRGRGGKQGRFLSVVGA